jgi:hypothetical protein
VVKINAVACTHTKPRPVPDSEAGEELRLWQDLGVRPTVRRAMATPYTKISSSHDGGLVESMADAKKARRPAMSSRSRWIAVTDKKS